jgi:hypothetical protein
MRGREYREMYWRGNLVGEGYGDSRNLRNYHWSHFVNSKSLCLKLTNADNLLAATDCVLYRTPNPDEETVQDVLNELQENNIDVSQLVDWSANHCQQAESSTEEGSSS